jgi:hypothetical protein
MQDTSTVRVHKTWDTAPLVIGEMKIKTAKRCHHAPTKVTNLKRLIAPDVKFSK